jgi:hypothetical protein
MPCNNIYYGQDVYQPTLVAGGASAIHRSHSNSRVIEAIILTLYTVLVVVIMTPTVAHVISRRRVTSGEDRTTTHENSYMHSESAYAATYSCALL